MDSVKGVIFGLPAAAPRALGWAREGPGDKELYQSKSEARLQKQMGQCRPPSFPTPHPVLQSIALQATEQEWEGN